MKPLQSIYSIGTFILLAAMSGCAAQHACSGSGCTSDEKTAEAVDAAISAHPDLGPPGQIRVSAHDHVVYLTGTEDTPLQVSTAEGIAAETDGVSEVVDDVSVTN
jgi:osmotically-inducible protein OsmY